MPKKPLVKKVGTVYPRPNVVAPPLIYKEQNEKKVIIFYVNTADYKLHCLLRSSFER